MSKWGNVLCRSSETDNTDINDKAGLRAIYLWSITRQGSPGHGRGLIPPQALHVLAFPEFMKVHWKKRVEIDCGGNIRSIRDDKHAWRGLQKVTKTYDFAGPLRAIFKRHVATLL